MLNDISIYVDKMDGDKINRDILMNGKSLEKTSRVKFCHCEGLYDRHEKLPKPFRFTPHIRPSSHSEQ
jgi:hypothetical protein